MKWNKPPKVCIHITRSNRRGKQGKKGECLHPGYTADGLEQGIMNDKKERGDADPANERATRV
jgi:hypothetical protein